MQGVIQAVVLVLAAYEASFNPLENALAQELRLSQCTVVAYSAIN